MEFFVVVTQAAIMKKLSNALLTPSRRKVKVVAN
jgi:hypothetical protein